MKGVYGRDNEEGDLMCMFYVGVGRVDCRVVDL